MTAYQDTRKECYLCKKKIEEIDYKDINLLSHCQSETGKIKSSKRTGNCAKHHRRLTKSLKRARYLALLPYITK